MSELNVYHHELRPNEYDEFYLKYEADKVVEEKDKEIARLNDKALQYKVLDKEHCRDLNTQERRFALQMAHHKYKRCSAMAGRCRLRARLFGACGLYEKELWALKWHRRWLELAERLKEAK